MVRINLIERDILRSVALFLVLTCTWGCSHRRSSVPGETFSAGYILSERQSKVVHEFVVNNTTSNSIKILDVTRSCTCSSFELGKYQLAPGESTKLKVEVEVPKGYMQKFATCVLKTDHSKFKEWAYHVTFTSLPFARPDPDVLNLGSFKLDGQNLNVVHNATLDLFDDAKIELTQSHFDVPDELKLTVSSKPEVRRLKPGIWNTRYRLSIELSPKGREAVLHNSQFGIITSAIQLTASKTKRWQYSIYWLVSAPLICHPPYLSFGNLLDDKDDHTRSILISSTNNETFRISSVRDQSEGVRIEFTHDTVEEALQHRLKFKTSVLRDDEQPSSHGPRRFFSGKIQVHTTDKLRPFIEIPWSAMLDPSVKQSSQTTGPKSASGPGVGRLTPFSPTTRRLQ